MYERKLLRWSRKCGIPIEDQGDLIFLHPSESNPSLQERLDGELGDKMDNNPEGIKLIINTLKSWFGADKVVDLINYIEMSYLNGAAGLFLNRKVLMRDLTHGVL